jgi:hypothetical protein
MPTWFFPTYEMIFGRLDIWLAAAVILACARTAMDDMLATVLVMAAGCYVTAGMLLGLAYMIFDTLA